jgi:hypothetical protein
MKPDSISGIAIMAKASIPARAKTRLVPPLSFDEAAEFNTAFCVSYQAAGVSLGPIPIRLVYREPLSWSCRAPPNSPFRVGWKSNERCPAGEGTIERHFSGGSL